MVFVSDIGLGGLDLSLQWPGSLNSYAIQVNFSVVGSINWYW